MDYKTYDVNSDRFIVDSSMTQILGTQNIFRDPIQNYVINANGYDQYNYIVDLIRSSSFNRRSNYNKNLIDFINKIIDERGLTFKIHPTKNFTKWKDIEFNQFSDITHRDFWNYLISLYKSGIIKIKLKEPSQKRTYIKFNTNSEFGDDINTFISNIPSFQIQEKVYKIIKKHLNEVYNFFKCIDSLSELQDLSCEIFSQDSLLNDLYNIEGLGIGKGEIVHSFLCKGELKGGTGNKSSDFLSDNGDNIEIKAPKNNESFRTGNLGSINSTDFYPEIVNSRNCLRYYIRQIGEDKLYQIVPNSFYHLCMQFISEGDYTHKIYNHMSSAIDSAEINQERFDLIGLFYGMAHFMTLDYSFVNNSTFQDIYTKDFSISNSLHNTLKLYNFDKYDNDYNLIRCILRSFKYVKNPLDLYNDIDKFKNKYMYNKILVIYREKTKTINICYTADDIEFDLISQNSIKLIEKSIKSRRNIVLESFYDCNNTPEDFYKTFCNIKSNKKVLKSVKIS